MQMASPGKQSVSTMDSDAQTLHRRTGAMGRMQPATQTTHMGGTTASKRAGDVKRESGATNTSPFMAASNHGSDAGNNGSLPNVVPPPSTIPPTSGGYEMDAGLGTNATPVNNIPYQAHTGANQVGAGYTPPGQRQHQHEHTGAGRQPANAGRIHTVDSRSLHMLRRGAGYHTTPSAGHRMGGRAEPGEVTSPMYANMLISKI